MTLQDKLREILEKVVHNYVDFYVNDKNKLTVDQAISQITQLFLSEEEIYNVITDVPALSDTLYGDVDEMLRKTTARAIAQAQREKL